MQLKKMVLAATAALTLSYGAASQAETFAECVSTDLVKFDGTIVDAALATPELSTLVDAVVAAGLVDTLATAENITVYAPTNDAFGNVPGGILNAVLGDPALLTAVLTYHVSPGKEDPRKYIKGERAPTLAGPSVFFHRIGGQARVNGAAVSCQGVQTSNGTVWVIDSVLIPRT
ncbi:MAG: fasciclin domain-containing protein [Halioglobus sp.]